MQPRSPMMRFFLGLGAAVMFAATAPATAHAADKVIKIGLDLSLTGADAQAAALEKDAMQMAFDAANQGNAVPGYKFELMILDDGTAATGQYDPAQAFINVKKMLADKDLVGALGPEMSGAGKAMAPFLSQGGLATITPTSTNPDISAPKFAMQYRPAGKPIYFRTVTTDDYQGPNMADFFAGKLKVKSVYVLDDGGAYGVGVVDTFVAQARKRDLNVLGSDRLDPNAADYTAILTGIKALNPDAIYYGGSAQAGVKLAKQAYEIVPQVIKGASDGMTSATMLNDVGLPAAEGWYITLAAPHLVEDARAAQFVAAFKSRFGVAPEDYSITAYDAALVMIDAVKRVVAAGHPVTRDTVRDAIQATNLVTLQGRVAFDANGDLKDHTMSVFKITGAGPVYQGAMGTATQAGAGAKP
jgi:branched-chain amino acid transport system substrate-binding protein